MVLPGEVVKLRMDKLFLCTIIFTRAVETWPHAATVQSSREFATSPSEDNTLIPITRAEKAPLFQLTTPQSVSSPARMFKLARSRPFTAAFQSSKVRYPAIEQTSPDSNAASGLHAFPIGWRCAAEESFEHT